MAEKLKHGKDREILKDSIISLAKTDPAQAKALFNVTLKHTFGNKELSYTEFIATEFDEKVQDVPVKPYYVPREAAEILGLSDQTIRRMCEKGKFPGAYQTDGGHWKIPSDLFVTNELQHDAAEKFFKSIDEKNKKAGEVNEFDL